jgi:hypothetical protein
VRPAIGHPPLVNRSHYDLFAITWESGIINLINIREDNERIRFVGQTLLRRQRISWKGNIKFLVSCVNRM